MVDICQNPHFMRVCEGVALRVLHACNEKDVFLTPVICFCSGVWFNTFNFPKTEVGYYKKVGPLFKPWRTLK